MHIRSELEVTAGKHRTLTLSEPQVFLHTLMYVITLYFHYTNVTLWLFSLNGSICVVMRLLPADRLHYSPVFMSFLDRNTLKLWQQQKILTKLTQPSWNPYMQGFGISFLVKISLPLYSLKIVPCDQNITRNNTNLLAPISPPLSFDPPVWVQSPLNEPHKKK